MVAALATFVAFRGLWLAFLDIHEGYPVLAGRKDGEWMETWGDLNPPHQRPVPDQYLYLSGSEYAAHL